jgi:DNA polymerase III subunit epsilon
MRAVVLDTETTGLDPKSGHRIVEIACLELLNHVPSGAEFHRFCNPERPMPPEAFAVHGLDDDFLRDKPAFSSLAQELLAFLGEAELIIHNAAFDLGFINSELERTGLPPLPERRVIDTVLLARKRFPGAQANLDALCRRFGIDISGRAKHGALVDARLLAAVYLELIGGRQPDFGLTDAAKVSAAAASATAIRAPRPHGPSAEELLAHEMFVAKLPNPIWKRG